MQDELKTLFRKLKLNGGMYAGYRQVIRSIERDEAKLVFLAKDCNEANYKALINGLCKQHNIPVNEKFARLELGELAGHYKMKGSIKDQKMGKVHPSSTVCIVDYSSLVEAEQIKLNELIQ